MRRITMNKKIVLFAVIAIASAAMTKAAQQDKKNEGKGSTVAAAHNDAASPADNKTAPIAATTDPAYLIGPEDVLDVSVWKEPDVSRVVPVRPDGRISLPLIDDVQAAGLSPQQLAKSVAEKLKK